MNCEYAKQLQAPFPAEDIEWKPQTSGVSAGGKAYVLAVPYITNRGVQERLDEVFGVFGWENEFQVIQDGFLCGITLHMDGKSVTKWDGAEKTAIEPLKGGLSGSMKRTAVQTGIGRYLYDLPEFWSPCVAIAKKYELEGYPNTVKGKGDKPNIAWKNPTLPEWALPTTDYTKYSEAIQAAENVIDLKLAFANSWNVAKINQNRDQLDSFKSEYDERLKFFDSKEVQGIAKETAEISDWVEAQEKNFSAVPSSSAVRLIYKNYKADLDEKCTNKFVDKKKFKARLKEIFENRINELKTKEK